MIIIFLLIWTILSIYAIYYIDHYYYWEHLFTVFISSSILAFFMNAWQIYDPNQNHMAVVIEVNETWNATLLLAIIEGICLTGIIAWGYIIKEKIKERRG